MIEIEDDGEHLHIVTDRSVGLFREPTQELIIEDCRVGIGGPPGTLPEKLDIYTKEKSSGI